MVWQVLIHPEFVEEVDEWSLKVKEELSAKIRLLQQYGPQTPRPHVDTLSGSKFPNMKELRFEAEKGVWRVAFAFDPERNAILLIGADKRGQNQKRFYKDLIKAADDRLAKHVSKLK
ncbi:type II toxin-antitoxin system RelE/ParE family toxin [Aquisalinus flavus]|uniref:Toxin RelE n=1 Tax=Aquisalinus flavus TaxID=1526572 RepID=A0A8J2V4Q3_9PROT|nr:type II toxin-antitoxin system RelE/ParE family toxin [Aquisalinus flavus]MBD0427239.1 type II toxin-antitoxin system RelE/ParE family toxin [Aquisalinus flavus]UNE47053.1 addiction module toxin RelE [Aquisalinus flavus]GGC99423.1 toxin RelE [Aquisalinus flavus]